MTLADEKLDADGFIKDPGNWSREFAESLAHREGIGPLSDDHWRIIDTLRQRYSENGSVPPMRQICHAAGLKDHCVSDLLADPLRAWRIAGLPDPGEEAKAYLQSAELQS
jgi:TusE/DsrC/DsvC family sulfur relay protein